MLIAWPVSAFHIFTVPVVNKNCATFDAAVRLLDGSIVLRSPPDVHGNPMGSGGALMTKAWGYDIVETIYVRKNFACKSMD